MFVRLLTSLALAAAALGSLSFVAAPAAEAKTKRVRITPDKKATRVKVDTGTLQGKVRDGGRQWLGVPYAAPPVGDRRWRPPAAPTAWKGVRKAGVLGPACIQSDTEYDRERGSEDCLYLNVYAPGRRAAKGKALPVMVWLHGGGFVNGSGNDFVGTRLAETSRTIVVTVNYRLGPFGWLALDSLSREGDGASGN